MKRSSQEPATAVGINQERGRSMLEMGRLFRLSGSAWAAFLRPAIFSGLIAATCLCGMAVASDASNLTAGSKPSVLSQVNFDPQPNARIPLGLQFMDEYGHPVRLSDYAGTKPIILALVYYTCPVLCNQVVEGIATGLRPLSLNAGKDFEVVAVSFNPRETAAEAMSKKQDAVARYHHPYTAYGWHFLTGEESSIAALTKAAGFRYVYDPGTKTYIHASGILILTPQGRISRYLSGVEYAPRDLKFALMQASSGKIGSVVDHFLLFCYQYNPANGKYGTVIAHVLYWSGIVTVVALASLILLLLRHEKRTASRMTAGGTAL